MDPKHLVRWISAALIAGAVAQSPGSAVAAVDPVSSWNSVAVQATQTGGQNAIVQSRTLAIAQAAVHDALNAIDSRYGRYAFTGNAQTGSSVDAAIAAAARDALVGSIAVGAIRCRTSNCNVTRSAVVTIAGSTAPGKLGSWSVAIGPTVMRCGDRLCSVIAFHVSWNCKVP